MNYLRTAISLAGLTGLFGAVVTLLAAPGGAAIAVIIAVV